VVWVSDVLPHGEISVINDVHAFVREIRSAFPDFKLAVLRTFDGGQSASEVAFEFSFDGTNAGFLANVGRTNRSARFTGHGVVTFDAQNKIERVVTSWDCAHVLAQLGIRPHMRPDPDPAPAPVQAQAQARG